MQQGFPFLYRHRSFQNEAEDNVLRTPSTRSWIKTCLFLQSSCLQRQERDQPVCSILHIAREKWVHVFHNTNRKLYFVSAVAYLFRPSTCFLKLILRVRFENMADVKGSHTGVASCHLKIRVSRVRLTS